MTLTTLSSSWKPAPEPDTELLRSRARIAAAVERLTRLPEAEGEEDATRLTLDLLLILDPLPDVLASTLVLPTASPSAATLHQRLADHLAESWPRLAYADFTDELAENAMDVIAPVVEQLQHAVTHWRRRTVMTLQEREQARRLAATLEQLSAAARDELRVGHPDEALALLAGDGGELQSEGVSLHGTSPGFAASGECKGVVTVTVTVTAPALHIADAKDEASHEAAGFDDDPYLRCGPDGEE